jgi:hypothetical protein
MVTTACAAGAVGIAHTGAAGRVLRNPVCTHRKDLDIEDISCMAKFGGNPWQDLDRAGNPSILGKKIDRVRLGVISDLGFCNQALHLPRSFERAFSEQANPFG